MTRWLLLGALMLSACGSAHAQKLSGGMRADFVASMMQGCLQQQSNGAGSLEVVQGYCRCFAEGLADRLTLTEMMGAGAVDAKVQEVIKGCKEVLQNSLKSS